MRRVGVVGLLAVAVCLGCSTAYVPRPGPRVAITMKDGNAAFVRDGKTYEGGIFGGGLVEAVHGNPRAEAHARAYRNLNIGGFCAVLGGGVTAVSGAVLVASGAQGGNAAPDRTKQTVGGAMLLGGLAAYVAGFVLILSAPPHVFDAVNVFNDGLPPESFRSPLASPDYGPTRASVRAGAATSTAAAPASAVSVPAPAAPAAPLTAAPPAPAPPPAVPAQAAPLPSASFPAPAP